MSITGAPDGEPMKHGVALGELTLEAAMETNAGRLAQRERVTRVLASRLAAATAESWRARLAAEGVPCGIVRTVPEVISMIDASARTGLPLTVPGTVRRPPPKLGEHSALVRARGWDAFLDASVKAPTLAPFTVTGLCAASSLERDDPSCSKRRGRHPVRQAESALLYRRENDGARTAR